ncbi:MAG: DUF4160 domain-containing protein [Pseudomonadota bacterium]
MPEISRFLGIVISMLYNEHNPPHFHAKYGNYKISVKIETGEITGKFPAQARKSVLKWLDIHREELMKDWKLAVKNRPLNKIEPLE